MSNGEKNDSPNPFPRADLYFYVIGTVVAAPLAKSGWDALMAGDRLRGSLALAAAVASAAGAFSYRYWESHLAIPTRRVVREIVSNKAFAAAAVLIFLGYGFVVMPDLIGRTSIPDFSAENSDLRVKIKALEDKNSSLQMQLVDASKELEKLRRQSNQLIPSNLTSRKAQLTELEKNLEVWKVIEKDGSDGLSTLKNTVSPSSIAQAFVKLRDRSIAAEVRQSQIYEKYGFSDVSNSIGIPGSLATPCNLLITLLSGLTPPVDVNRDILDQPAYQSLSDAVNQLAGWIETRELKFKQLNNSYQEASTKAGGR